ncbi:tannase/feruloyl esterase family alpha/beta hydrolase [Novosphingobium sp. Gsoil 351]|uniref:tannase/feruloyl esterase family alpha/beta hydrolase n=1 Tax=Novosphingobium sp. Gsoil 351 TaxID=2675225 RepID=UPI0018A830BE|nr:tannase/feruloyl esterase family alpha/beta hydrolase [Novosphingobium sp. Gsoil 351]
MIRALFLAVALLLAPGHAWAQAAPPSAKERCEALAGGRFEKLEGAPTYIVSAKLRPAGGVQPEACLVEGYVNPTVNFAILLPSTTWNGRYMVRGCGGSCGAVVIDLACARHVRDGYACLHTDMGHRSTLIDNTWVPNNLQGLVDFGYRATHVTTVAGRAIIKAFYAADPAKSYFFACSTGGRQGLIEAQRFPDDFDGIVAMAPASMAPFGNRKPATISDVNGFNTGQDGRPIFPNRKTLLLHAAVIKACDKRDGLVDGLISAPLACPFKPAQLLCKGSDTRDCLTAPQVAVAEKMYAWRGTAPGSELRWIGTLIPNAPLPGEAWAPIPDLGADRGDPTTIETMVAPNNPDLRPFRDRGGKLILVQGWSDAIVAPAPTLDYYQTVQRTMGGAAETAKFARLFMVPGMEHCSGGDGAWAIDHVAALTAWVERGEAPEALRGVHPDPAAKLDYFATGLPEMDPKYVAFARDHRAWPGSSVAVKGLPVVPSRNPLRPLAQALGDAAEAAVRSGTASGYARRSTLNLTLTEMWQVLAACDGPVEEQRAALTSLAASARDPLVAEAARRLQAELLLD